MKFSFNGKYNATGRCIRFNSISGDRVRYQFTRRESEQKKGDRRTDSKNQWHQHIRGTTKPTPHGKVGRQKQQQQEDDFPESE